MCVIRHTLGAPFSYFHNKSRVVPAAHSVGGRDSDKFKRQLLDLDARSHFWTILKSFHHTHPGGSAFSPLFARETKARAQYAREF